MSNSMFANLSLDDTDVDIDVNTADDTAPARTGEMTPEESLEVEIKVSTDVVEENETAIEAGEAAAELMTIQARFDGYFQRRDMLKSVYHVMKKHGGSKALIDLVNSNGELDRYLASSLKKQRVSSLPTMESFGTHSVKDSNTKVYMEAIGDKLRNGIEAVKSFAKMIWKWIKEKFAVMWQSMKDMGNRVRNMFPFLRSVPKDVNEAIKKMSVRDKASKSDLYKMYDDNVASFKKNLAPEKVEAVIKQFDGYIIKLGNATSEEEIAGIVGEQMEKTMRDMFENLAGNTVKEQAASGESTVGDLGYSAESVRGDIPKVEDTVKAAEKLAGVTNKAEETTKKATAAADAASKGEDEGLKEAKVGALRKVLGYLQKLLGGIMTGLRAMRSWISEWYGIASLFVKKLFGKKGESSSTELVVQK